MLNTMLSAERNYPAASAEVSHRLQLVLSPDAASSLIELRDRNGCASYSETIRRAVDFLYRVVMAIGVPSSLGTQEKSEPLTARVPVTLNSVTYRRINELSEMEGGLKSKSEVIRSALELYSEASENQINMKEKNIIGPKGQLNSSLAFMP